MRQAEHFSVEGAQRQVFSPEVSLSKRANLSTPAAVSSREGARRGVTSLEFSQPKRSKQAVAAAVPLIYAASKPPEPNRLISNSDAAPTHLPPGFGKQMKQAEIPRLDRGIIQLPRVHSSYNDDVKLDAFFPADMTYAGRQRRGIHENFESCTSMRDHAIRALNERFPLAAPIPMPEHIKKAAVFTLVEMKQLELSAVVGHRF